MRLEDFAALAVDRSRQASTGLRWFAIGRPGVSGTKARPQGVPNVELLVQAFLHLRRAVRPPSRSLVGAVSIRSAKSSGRSQVSVSRARLAPAVRRPSAELDNAPE